ncbi:MAG: hypothetical protein VB933_04785 [Pseudomonadales bacterium]
MIKLGSIMESASHTASTHVDNSYVTGKGATLDAPNTVTDFRDWAVTTETFVQHIEIK